MVGDDVALGAGLAAADGEHGGLARRDLAGHDRLQPDDDHRGQHYRTDGVLRHGTVAAAPYTVIFMLSAADRNGPGRVPTVPATPGRTCWASATSGAGMRSSRPSPTMPRAPSPVSSAGWNSATRFPFHRPR